MPNNNTDCTADFDISSVEPEKINSGFEFTLLTSNNSNLCKSYRTSKDGESFKSAAAALSQGNGTKVELENLKDWDSYLSILASEQAISFGVFEQDSVNIVNKNNRNLDEGRYSRCKGDMSQPDGRTLVLFDTDPHEKGLTFDTAKAFGKYILNIFPDIELHVRASSSAGITFNGEALKQAHGWHGYALLAKGINIEKVKEKLISYEFTEGHGYIAISKIGHKLVRGTFDFSVYNPERIIFEAPPTLDEHHEQIDQPSFYTSGKLISNKMLVCEDVSSRIKHAKEHPDLDAEIAEAETLWLMDNTKKIKTKLKCSDEEAEAQARERLTRAADGEPTVLMQDDLLTLSDGSQMMVKDACAWVLELGQEIRLPDPNEGMEYGPQDAKLHYNPRIGKFELFSFAHGEGANLYVIDDSCPEMFDALNPEVDHAPTLPSTLLDAKLDAVLFPDQIVNSKTGAAKVLNTRDNLAALLKIGGAKVSQNLMTLDLTMMNKDGEVCDDFELIRSDLIGAASKTGLPKMVIDDHFTALGRANNFHPVAKLISGCKWDGVKRVDRVIDALNGEDVELTRLVMRKWFTGCVAALFENMFNTKMVPVLQGGQSFMKTAVISRFANIMPHSFLEGHELDPENKDSVITSIKSWITELGELERTNKNSQHALKAYISKGEDTVRLPYGRSDINKKRQTMYIGTVNSEDFLKDDTGSTRFQVIKMMKPVNIELVNELLGWEYDGGRMTNDPLKLLQFWAEIKAMYDGGLSWHLTPDEQAQTCKVANAFTDKGPYYITIIEYYGLDGEPCEHVREYTTSDVAADIRVATGFNKQVGKALATLERDGFITSRIGRGRVKYYNLPNRFHNIFNED